MTSTSRPHSPESVSSEKEMNVPESLAREINEATVVHRHIHDNKAATNALTDVIFQPAPPDGISDPYRLLRQFSMRLALLGMARNRLPLHGHGYEQLWQATEGNVQLEFISTNKELLDELAETEGITADEDTTLGPDDIERITQPDVAAVAAHRLLDQYIKNPSDHSVLLRAYSATLLAGNPDLYESMHEQAIQAYRKRNDRFNGDYDFIRDRIIDFHTLHELPDLLEDDLLPTVKEYLAQYSLLTICTGLSEAKRYPRQYRTSMLKRLNTLVFDQDLKTALDEAWALVEQDRPHEPIADLDWTVLPYGQLAEHAKEIVESNNTRTGTSAEIDLARLNILENIRDWWNTSHGDDASYYSRGVRLGRRNVRDKSGNPQPDEYIMLILKQTNEAGEIIEHAIAESPVAGPNALYIQRQDVNGWDWRELMKHSKADVRSMGARAVKHEAPQGSDLIDVMTAKVRQLLTCNEQTFLEGQFGGIDKYGQARLRSLSRSAVQTTVQPPQ